MRIGISAIELLLALAGLALGRAIQRLAAGGR